MPRRNHDRAVLVVRERHWGITAHRHEDGPKRGVAKQCRAFVRNGMGMVSGLAVREDDPAALAVDGLQVLRDGSDRNNQNVALPVHEILRVLSLKKNNGSTGEFTRSPGSVEGLFLPQSAMARVFASSSGDTNLARNPPLPRASILQWRGQRDILTMSTEPKSDTPKEAVAFSDEIAAEICARLSDGASLRSICAGPRMPHRATVIAWLSRYPAFATAYSEAKLQGCGVLFEDLAFGSWPGAWRRV
jgi:hypothetical protein